MGLPGAHGGGFPHQAPGAGTDGAPQPIHDSHAVQLSYGNPKVLTTDLHQQEHLFDQIPYIELVVIAIEDLEGLDDPLLPSATWRKLPRSGNMTFPQVCTPP